MNRRDFLRNLMAAPIAMGTFLYGNPFQPKLRLARAATGKTLVVIFQRGGCDGLNTVVPYGDSEYYNLRPNIAVPPPGGEGTALDLNGFFGLHPSLAPLHSIYNQGSMAIMPAVHYPNASRSHFDGQHNIESGTTGGTMDGWLNRHLMSQPEGSVLRAAGFGSELPHAFRGEAHVATIENLSDFFGYGGNDGPARVLREKMRSIYEQAVNPAETNRAALHESGLVVLENMEILNNIDTENYVPANGALYPNDSYGRQLRQTAQLIKEGVGLELVTINIGGWDTHSGQGGAEPTGSLSRRHAQFAEGINALYTDLGILMDDVVILTMSEFGRTARENGSRGTDHGNASAWLVIGGGVRGGIYGAWPGLSSSRLYLGRYLDHSIDFRDVMGEVLRRHLQNSDLATTLPGHGYTPIGFL